MEDTTARQHDDTTDHVKEAQERIGAEVDTLMEQDNWRRYLRLQSRFHHYSFGNMLLIASQCENPTYLKGFKGWLDLGRSVQKGEKAIRILAPLGRGGSDRERRRRERGRRGILATVRHDLYLRCRPDRADRRPPPPV